MSEEKREPEAGEEAQLLERELDRLRRLRDELRVQLHLAGAEAKERYEALEGDLHHLEGRLRSIREHGREEARELGRGARALAEEIRTGYRELRERLARRSPRA